MDVQLLVYDLSRGLARQMSMGILGFQLDAIYHTSIQLNGREYVYDGGIIAIVPGSSHLGQPMQKIPLGTTHLPLDVIEEFLDSIRPIFTLEVSPKPWLFREYLINVFCARHMTCFAITATTLATPFPTSSLAKASLTISSTCHRRLWILRWDACCYRNSHKVSMQAGQMARSSVCRTRPGHLHQYRIQGGLSSQSQLKPSYHVF